MEFILILLGIILGGLGIFLILRPRLKSVKQINNEVNEQNFKLIEKNKELNKARIELEEIIDYLTKEKISLTAQKQEIYNSLTDLQRMAEESATAIYDKTMSNMYDTLENSAETARQKYQTAEQQFQDEYLEILTNMAFDVSRIIEEKQQQIQEIDKKLSELNAKQCAAIEAAKRQEEKELELDKYKINVTELDLLEINRLREIAPYFRNPRAIYKIIWESYYRNLTTELINRVVGVGSHTGIYKITNLKNEKVYIGQAADVGNRWKDHIKAGLGIDTPNNKIYAAMMEDGVENFTFELLEKCTKEELNNRETYWIEYYQSQDWGYNMTKGGARK